MNATGQHHIKQTNEDEYHVFPYLGILGVTWAHIKSYMDMKPESKSEATGEYVRIKGGGKGGRRGYSQRP